MKGDIRKKTLGGKFAACSSTNMIGRSAGDREKERERQIERKEERERKWRGREREVTAKGGRSARIQQFHGFNFMPCTSGILTLFRTFPFLRARAPRK